MQHEGGGEIKALGPDMLIIAAGQVLIKELVSRLLVAVVLKKKKGSIFVSKPRSRKNHHTIAIISCYYYKS